MEFGRKDFKVDIVRNYERQLYTLFGELKTRVDDSDERGTIVGYAIINTLKNFKTNSGSMEEIKFLEVKTIYNGLEKVIYECNAQSSYKALCDLRIEVDPFVEYVSANLRTVHIEDFDSQEFVQSGLLRGVIKNIFTRRGSYVDKIRRNGIALCRGVIERGPLNGRYNILTGDYEAIRDYFVLRR